MTNTNVNRDNLVEGFEAYEAVEDRRSYNSDICSGSYDQALDAYNEFKQEENIY